MKKIIVLIIINLFIFNSIGYAAVDCANPEKMTEKSKCRPWYATVHLQN